MCVYTVMCEGALTHVDIWRSEANVDMYEHVYKPTNTCIKGLTLNSPIV